MTAKDLKNALLQEAVQGKLVPQIASEGNAQDLLKKIEDERKKSNPKYKPLPPITDEEKPFEIPESWEWCRLGKIAIIRDSERIPLSVAEREKLQKKYDYYGASGVIDKVDKFLFDKPLLLIGEDGANLLSRSTPIAFIAEGKYWVNNHAHVLDFNENCIFMKYIMYYINAISLAKYVTGTAQPKMNQEKMNSIPIPLPPLSEQKRIVAKLEEMLPLVEEYGKAQEELDTLNNEIPEKLKKAILQEAVQGKLVPQIASEGNAKDLLHKIETERKKSNPKYKPLPPVTDEEKPFDIPESWVWVRLGDIGYFVRGKGFLKRDFVKKGFPCLHYGQIHMIFNTATSKTITYISDEMAKKSGIASPQDVILAITSEDVEGSCKPVAWLGNYDIAIGAHTAIYKHSINALFLSYYFQTICFAKQKSQYTHGSKVVEIKPGDIANCFFPLPPLSEQKRIVAKLEELLGEVEKLKR